MSKTESLFVISILLGIAILVLAPLVGVSTNKVDALEKQVTQLKEQAIQHGAAYYHPETAEFTWKEKKNAEGN